MEGKIVKRQTKKPETLTKQVKTLQRKVLELEKQVSHLKAKEKTQENESIPDIGLMQMVVDAVEHDKPPKK